MKKKKTTKVKVPEDDKFTIVRDTREQAGCGWQFNASGNCHGMVSEKLDTGDYSLKGFEHLVMIERKTIADLWGTLTVGKERFNKEMERAKVIPARFLIIEGNISDIDRGFRYSKVSPEFIHASLISLQVKYGIHVIFAGRQDVARGYVRRLLARLYRYCKEGVISGPRESSGEKTSD